MSTAGSSVHNGPESAPSMPVEKHHRVVTGFDLPGTIRRIRRLADLSQRELGQAIAVPKSRIAAAESGAGGLDARVLADAAAVAGLRLALLDDSGRHIGTMAAGAVRDLGGRRFPAHLDTHRSGAGSRLHEPRRDRPETSFTYGRDRDSRDVRRRAHGTPSDHHPVLPGDTPLGRLTARQHAAAVARAEERERRFLAGESRGLPEPFACHCPAACDALDDWSGRPLHAAGCACGCDVG